MPTLRVKPGGSMIAAGIGDSQGATLYTTRPLDKQAFDRHPAVNVKLQGACRSLRRMPTLVFCRI